MHVLMISMDTSLLTQRIGNTRARHEIYAEQSGRLSVVVCNRGTDLAAYDSSTLHVVPTQSRGYLNYLLDGYRTGMRFHAEQPVDLITTQDPFLTALIGLMLRRRIRARLLIQDHSCLLENEYFAAERPRNRLLQLLARQTVRRADAVRVVNHQEQSAAVRRGARNVCTIPVSTNFERFTQPATDAQKAAWYAKLEIEPGTPLVLWVGRIVPVKNLPLLLKAFARVHAEIPAAHLVIAGGADTLPAQTQGLGLTSAVHFPGTVVHADLPALYQIATLYALASNYEGLPLVLVEAAASGLPAISTATAGAREVIVDGDMGILVPIGDEVAMADAIIRLLRDPARAAAMGIHARDHVRQCFDEQRLIAQWMGLWRAVAAGEKPPCAS